MAAGRQKDQNTLRRRKLVSGLLNRCDREELDLRYAEKQRVSGDNDQITEGLTLRCYCTGPIQPLYTLIFMINNEK